VRGLLDLAHTVVDSSHLPALKRELTGPSPVDRGRLGSKDHLITDASGIPLAVSLTGGHRNDVTQLPLLEAIPPIRGPRSRPRRRPSRKVYADRGDDHDTYRQLLWERGIIPVNARRGTAHGSGLGRLRRPRNAPSPGSRPSDGSAPVTNAAPTPTRR
jgi:hypothetical protein